MSQLSFCLDELVRHLREHRGVAALAAVTMALAFFLLSIVLMLGVNIRAMTRAAADELRMQVYLRDEIEPAQQERVKTRLSQERVVQSVVFVSKDEALIRLRAQLKERAAVLEGLGNNPLPASFEVRLRQEPALLADVPGVAGRIEAEAGVEQVRYGEEWLGRFRVVLAFLGALGWGVGGVVALAVVAIVANTIRFMIDARRDDIAVLKIVGASHSVIALPYVLEGICLGACGVLLAVGGLAGVAAWAGPRLEAVGGFLLAQGGLQFLPLHLTGLLLAGGALLGGVGSVVALRRHFQPA